MKQQTLIQQLQLVAKNKKNEPFATWHEANGSIRAEYTFGQLWEKAGIVAQNLRKKWGVEKGDKVILCYGFGLHFLAAFLGCIRAGVVAVLVYPPTPPLTKSLTKMNKVISDCNPALILTDTKIFAFKKLDELRPFSKSCNMWPKGIEFKVTDLPAPTSWRKKETECFTETNITQSDIAFYQYTSGSTGDPKGVMVTHGALQANVQMIRDGFISDGFQQEDTVGFSWLPQYHDLGLILGCIAPIANGWRMHMMSPLTFIKQPLLWVELMSRHRVTFGSAPDFAYHLVARKFAEEKAKHDGNCPIPNLDLSALRHIMNAAEPIRLDTLDTFHNAFGEFGLKQDWLRPAYGLAESVVGVSFCDQYHPSTLRPEDSKRFVAVGHRDTFHPSVTIKIVDPVDRCELEDNQTGELWVGGPSVASGYHGKPDLSKEVFRAQLRAEDGHAESQQTFLRTGDLAFLQDGYLYICGRIKDLIIVNGVNYYPQDIELTVQEASASVRPGCVAAFSSDDSGGERGGQLEVVFEIRKGSIDKAQTVCKEVQSAIVQHVGLMPSKIIAVEERSIAKTTSGKIQRKRNRELLHAGAHKTVFLLEQLLVSPDGEKDDSTADNTSSETGKEDGPVTPSEKYDAIISSVLGPACDPQLGWEDNGLTSLILVELTNKLAQAFPVAVPSDFSDQYPTPAALKEYILSPQSGSFFPVEMPNYDSSKATHRSFPWLVITGLQAVGIIILFLMLSASAVPSYWCYRLVVDSDAPAGLQILLPFVFLLWPITFSLLVVFVKWAVIYQYRPTEVSLASLYFVRWWFVDRAVHLWEMLAGRYVKDTPWIWLFYTLMGSKIHPSAKVDCFIREFDLVNVGSKAEIGFGIKCRKFGPWLDSGPNEGTPTMRFRPITVGDNSKVLGQVSPGVTIADGCRVEKLAAVPEGAQVPAGAMAVGSPAFQANSADAATNDQTNDQTPTVLLAAVKCLWPVLDLYLTFAAGFVASIIVQSALSALEWRYATLLRAFLVIVLAVFGSLMLCIPMKWIFIGRRRPGKVKEGALQEAIDWAIDYHFSSSVYFFNVVAENTVLVNVFLLLLGGDIDLQSKVWPDGFLPSKADLIEVKQSMLSVTSFEIEEGGVYKPVSILNSSLGHTVVVAAGVSIKSAQINPLTYVTKDVQGDPQKEANLFPFRKRCLVDLAIAPIVMIMFCSLIPSYEFFHQTGSFFQNPLLGFPLLQVASTLVVFCMSWYTLLVLLHSLTYPTQYFCRSTDSTKPWSMTLFAVYLELHCYLWELSLLPIFWGTPYFNVLLGGLGCRVEGRVFFFGNKLYDSPLLTLLDKTIIDSASLNGHFVVYDQIQLGPTTAAGVFHEGSFCLANTHLVDPNHEAQPMQFVTPQSRDM